MIKNILAKIILIKQKKCIISLKYVLQDENIEIYKNAQSIIKYHQHFLSKSLSSIVSVKNYYNRDLISRKERLKIKNLTNDEKVELLAIIDADMQLLLELNDDFINNYSQIIYNMNIVNKYSKYLDNSQKLLLDKYNELIVDSQVYTKNTIFYNLLSK